MFTISVLNHRPLLNGNNIKDLTIRTFIFSIVLLFICNLNFAQVKSSNIQVINGASYYIHPVEKGQSLYSISKLYGVSLEEIYQINPEAKTGTKAGQEIKIPVKTKQEPKVTEKAAVNSPTSAAIKSPGPAPAPQNKEQIAGPDTNLYHTHKVGRKETMYAITKKYSVTEAELKIWNPSLISQGLKEGQLIIVGEKPKAVKVKAVEPKQRYTHPDSINPDVIIKPKKSSYTVSLLLPFKLDPTLEMDMGPLIKNRSGFPAMSALAVDFYLGFKKAIDSLIGNDFELNLDLFDIDDKDSLKLVQLLNDAKFKQSDMIFGPFHANGFKTTAQKAKELQIPVISPVIQQNKILFSNVYASKTNPSQFTLLESLADYCMDSLMVPGARLLLVAPFGKDVKEESYVKAFKKYYNERKRSLGGTAKDTVAIVKGIAGIKAAYLPDARNIVVMLNTNHVFISDFTTQLAIFSDKKDVILCGWQSTSSIDNLDQEYLNQLHYTFPSQNNIINLSAYTTVNQSYKAQQNTYPGEYFYMGFDIAYYYLKNLKEQGPGYVYSLNKFPLETNYMRFKFTRPDNQTGFDNRGAYIFRYSDYQLIRTGWK